MQLSTINVIEIIDNGKRPNTVIITSFSNDPEGCKQAEELFTNLAISAGYVESDWHTWDYTNQEYRVFLRYADEPHNA